MNPGTYTYEARVGGFWRKDGKRFTVESARPLKRGDTVLNGEEGKNYRVTCEPDHDDAGVHVLVVLEECVNRRPSRRTRPGAASLIKNLGTVYADLPGEHRALFERQLQRLVDLYRPVACGT